MIKRVLVIWILSAGVVWGQGYTIRNDEVVVDRQRHWAEWHFAAGTVNISEQGEIRPHFVRKSIDATQDIVTHLKRHPPGNKKAEGITVLDAVKAGTNATTVPNLFDGDESTYWEPAADSPLREWWFQIDLGRLVSANRIVLKFIAEGEGDPFLQFVVLSSDGTEAKRGEKRFNRAFRAITPNKDQRVFEIDLEPSKLNIDGRMSGDQIRFVQVVITATDSLRAAEVSAEEYELLEAADRGEVDYYKKAADGEVQVSQATYEAVDAQLRGSVRYYRRERPRLAELEVWTIGENISLGVVERKGVARTFLGTSATMFFDGLFETSLAFTGEEVRDLFFDLGAMYWIDTHQIYYDPQRSRFSSYDLQTSDGTLAADGYLLWTTQASQRNRRSSAHTTGDVYDSDRFPPVRARFVRILFWSEGGLTQHKPSEIQFFGEGFQPEVELTSPLIRLGAAKNLASIEWDGHMPPGTFIEVQTRTGEQLAEVYRYFNKSGQELSAEAYDKLGFFQKGRIDTLEVPGADWSAWSLPYETSGAFITSPSPRQLLLMRVRFLSDDPYTAASLSALRLNFIAPLVSQLLGELEPGTVEELGVEQTLSLFIKPTFARESPGFDEILVRAPANMELEFRLLRVGREAQWESAEPEPDVQMVPTRSDSLWLGLDRVVGAREADLVEVQFATTLFGPGAVFRASVGNSGIADSWQRVDAADATELATSQGMLLVGPVEGKKVLDQVQVRPEVVTPNGDGINDEMTFAFSVRKLTGSQAVEIRIYDLAGRLVRQWEEERSEVSGAYTLTWSGDDQAGQTVAPGIYLLEIRVDADSDEDVEQTVVHRVIQVAY